MFLFWSIKFATLNNFKIKIKPSYFEILFYSGRFGIITHSIINCVNLYCIIKLNCVKLEFNAIDNGMSYNSETS